jgi:hypothetical protein
MMKSLNGLLHSLFVDLKRLHPHVEGLDRDELTIKARVEDEGIGFLAVALPAFGKHFDQALSLRRFAHIPGFCRHRNESLPKFLLGLTSLVFDSLTGRLLDNPSVEAIVSLRQLFYLFKKFVPSDSRDELLERIAMREFLDVESSIKELPCSYARRLEHVCRFILQDLDEFQELDCKHGPGAVLEGYTANQKWEAVYSGLLDFDQRLLDAGYDLPASLLVSSPVSLETIEDYPFDSSARVVTVPKSCSALRTITVEPCLNQFVQQGYNARLRDCISRDPVLRQTLVLSDQRPNQELALNGSRTGDWCTIDLSSASDLLSLQTVVAVFAHRPRFLEGILRCRTPRATVGSNTIVLKKYAGMGNATTFPIQSVAFAMIATAAILGQTKELSYEKVLRASRNVQVFGDDIIVQSEHFEAVADWIKCFGLKINRSKTFSEGNFRESCGVDAYGGTDVTPCYLRHDPAGPYKDPSHVASLVESSNHLWLSGYYQASEFIRTSVESSIGRLPLVRKDSHGLGWHTRLDATEIQRWNPSLHRFEVRTCVLTPRRREDALSGYPALIKYFHLPQIGEDDPTHLSSSVRKFSLNLRRRWVQS